MVLSIEVSDGEILVSPFSVSGFAFLISQISVIMPWLMHIKNFCTPLSAALQKCFQSGSTLAKAGPNFTVQ